MDLVHAVLTRDILPDRLEAYPTCSFRRFPRRRGDKGGSRVSRRSYPRVRGGRQLQVGVAGY